MAIAVSLVVGLIVAAALANQLLIQAFADRSGVRVAQYNSAVASWINAQGAAVPPGNYNGIGWLQNAATCAGATGTQDFIPCGWNDALSFGLQFRTRVDTNATDPAVPPGRARAVTNLGTPVMSPGGVPRLDYGSRVILAAQAYVGISQLRAQNMVGMTSYRIQPDPGGGANDQLIAQVDTATAADPWLRIDGGNRMEADIHANGHDLDNARDVNATGTVRGQDLNASRDVNASRDTNTARNASAGQNVTGNTVWGNNVGSNGNVSAGNDVTAGRDVNARNDVKGDRDVTANNNPALGGDVKIANSAVPGTGSASNPGGNISLAGSLQGTQIVTTDASGRAWVDKPQCPGGRPAGIESLVAQVSNGGTAEPLGYFASRAVDGASLPSPFTNPSRWAVYVNISTPTSGVAWSPANNRIAVSLFCQP